jgi:zinc transport system permease protein
MQRALWEDAKMNNILSVFSYSFMVNAFIAGSLISLCSALIGVIVVLKRYSMIGDGLSHVGFGALTVAAVLGLSPLYVAIPVVVICALILMRISDLTKIKGDAAIGLISTGALAFGTIIVSACGVNTDLNSYLFGSILSLTSTDMILCVILCIAVLFVFLMLYNKIFAVTFDESFAKSVGIKTNLYNSLIAVLCALTIVLGMRMMGSLLISALIIFPALTAMRIFKSFRAVTISAVIIAVLSFFAGMIISFNFSTPAGATVVGVNIIMFALFSVLKFIKTH